MSFPDVYTTFNKAWMETFDKLGWKCSNDPINGETLGAFTCPLSIHPKTKSRGYATSYYTPEVAQKSNLQLLTDTHVERVLLDRAGDSSVSATGVQVRTKEGKQEHIAAKREVIVSAGAIHSPRSWSSRALAPRMSWTEMVSTQ